jgi:hypothetical protein
MRTTLTLDDDIAKILQRRARELDKSFKEVVNATLRNGLAKEDLPVARRPVPKVVPRNLGLKAGIDPDKLNQLVDELEAEEFARKYRNR